MRCADPLLRILSMCALLIASLPAHADRDISPKRECAICHIAWIADFKRAVAMPLIPYEPRPMMSTGRQDVASSERMCWSCHDGFVLDARLAWAGRGHSHPVGVVPSGKVRIPTRDSKKQFPLNDEGKVYCGTCHSAHGVDWEGKQDSRIFLRMPNVDSSLCVACHLERSTGPAEGNHPVYKPLKEIPGALRGTGSRFSAKGELICESCHRMHGAADRKILVMPNDSSQLCGTCHSDRYAMNGAQAGRMGTHPVNVKPDQAVISTSLLEAGGKLNPDGKIICQTCHRPHFAQTNERLLIERNPQSQLCQSCHLNQKTVLEGKHNLMKLDRSVTNRRGQEVRQAGACSACHLPHRGAGPKMAAQDAPAIPSADGVSNLCLSCHRAGGIADAKQVGEHSHPVGRDLARVPGHTELPGFSEDGVKIAGVGMVGCATCHDPHRADVAATAASPSKLLRKANEAASSLCRECHADKEGIANTKHDLAAMAPDSKNIKGQMAAQAGLCGNCHLPHNGKGPRMWAREAKAGVDPVSATCLSCHDENGVARAKLVGDISHPVGVAIEKAGVIVRDHQWERSDGSSANLIRLPLYDDKGVPTASGGNVTCGACHDPHNWSADKKLDAGKNPKEVKGSRLSRFLRLPIDGNSTLCSNCHGNKEPVARSKHNLGISAPNAPNAGGQTVADTGTCGACHQPHNAKGAKLWARDEGRGGDAIERKCTACHKQDGVAGKKLTGPVSHPLGAGLASIGGGTTLPMFLADGTRDPAKGKLSCATCHDVHQWKPGDAASINGAEAKALGDATTSFLRLRAAPDPELCVNCHTGKDSVRLTDHDLAITAPQARNAAGQTPQQSGPCLQCHLPHNAVSKVRLWAQPLGPGSDAMETLCRSCHSDGRVAENKQPVKGQHPQRVTVLADQSVSRPGMVVSDMPVFEAGGRRSSSGQITCPTCHNPHQWEAGKQSAGLGRNLEGDATNSFLRGKSEFALCINCHGLDSLFRYKYFHGESSRRKHRLYR